MAALIAAGIVAGMRGQSLLLILISFFSFLILFYMVRKHIVTRGFLIFPIFMITGYMVASTGNVCSLVKELEGGIEILCSLTGRVKSAKSTDYGYALILENVKVQYDETKIDAGNCLVYADQSFSRGDVVAVTGKAEAFPLPDNPGEFNQRQYYRTTDVWFRIYGDSVRVVQKNSNPVYTVADRISEAVSMSYHKIADEKSASVFDAVVLGRKEQLDRGIKELFSACGIGHILAISGLHISLIGMGFYKLLRKMGAGYGLSMVIGTAFIIFYGIMSGGGISTTRALIMYITAVYANACGRTYDMLSGASLAAVMMLLDNPYVIYSGGFWLSYGAVIGIGVVGDGLTRAFSIESKAARTVISGVSIQLVTVPVIMYCYYEVPVFAILLNLVVVPLMTVLMISALSGGIIGIFSLTLGKISIGSAVFILRFYEWVCRENLRLPWAVWVCGQPKPWQLAAYYILLFSAVTLITRKNGKKAVFLLAPAVFSICIRLKSFQVDFLYVGQGDGIFIRASNQSTYLVDCGSSDKNGLYEYTLEPFLLYEGVAELDGIVVSHCDNDHISGIGELLCSGKIKVRAVYMPYIANPDEAYYALWQMAEKAGADVKYIYEGMKITEGQTEITCIHPSYNYRCEGRNGYSTTLVVQYNDFSMLLTGDIGSEQEKIICDKVRKYAPFDVLKVAHHGSEESNTPEFLRAVSPLQAVISCGKNNSYGHPHEETIKRLEATGCNILRTDELGAVIFTVSPSGEVEKEGYKHSVGLRRK